MSLILGQAQRRRGLQWASARVGRAREWDFHRISPVTGSRLDDSFLHRIVFEHVIYVFLRVDSQRPTGTRLSADDTTFRRLHCPINEVCRGAHASSHGEPEVGGRPRTTPCHTSKPPMLEGLAPTGTAHHLLKAVPRSAHGAMIVAQIINPPEWTERVPEVVPLGLERSPYPDRIVPKAGQSEADAKVLQKRTLTNLYNLRPAWLAMAHEVLDAAVATAYGWADYSPTLPDDELLARLLALNLQRAGAQA